jgi:hypothetical protein
LNLKSGGNEVEDCKDVKADDEAEVVVFKNGKEFCNSV